jgi:hypothetical protein
MDKYTITKPLTLSELENLVQALKVKPLYPQTSCGCGEGWTDERCNKLNCATIECIFQVIEINKENPEKYDLKECFEDQIEEIKGKYGYMQKHFTPLVTYMSKERVQMLFCGLELILKSDGTYFITDTTGG